MNSISAGTFLSVLLPLICLAQSMSGNAQRTATIETAMGSITISLFQDTMGRN